MPQEKWAFARHEDHEDLMFYGQYATRDEAIAGARAEIGQEFRTGRCVHPLDVIDVDVDGLFEQLECALAEEVGSDLATVRLPPEKLQELETTITGFLREHAVFGSDCVIDVEHHKRQD